MYMCMHIHVHVYTYCTDVGFSCLACTSVCLNTTTLTKFNTGVYTCTIYKFMYSVHVTTTVVIEVTVYVCICISPVLLLYIYYYRQSLPNDESIPATAASQNKSKNRFANIHPCKAAASYMF